ncbi:MAG: hypothetical protein LAO56_25710 [Acidobacteriia bacterium]|nr:hypothetical protein [Terriglobia bacterium]
MFPSISVPLSFSFGKSNKDKNESTTPLQPSAETAAICISSDAVLVLMLIVLIMMSSAVLVYAARH